MPREGSKSLILVNIFFILAAIFSSIIQNVNIFFICVLITSIYMMVKFKDKPTNKCCPWESCGLIWDGYCRLYQRTLGYCYGNGRISGSCGYF